MENGTLVPACPGSCISLLYLQPLTTLLFAQGDQFVHCAMVENPTFTRSLDFYELVLRRHHHVEIDIGTRVFFVAQVKQYLAAYYTHTHGCHGCFQRMCRQHTAFH